MCRRGVVTNQKGGVGATTFVANAAHRLAQYGWKTVVFGLDPQVNLEMLLGVEGGDEGIKYLEHIIADSRQVVKPASTQKHKRDNLFYVPGCAEYGPYAGEVAQTLGRKKTEADQIEYLKVIGDRIFSVGENPDGEPFDLVLADTSKSNVLQQAAIAAADFTIVPFRFDFSVNNTLGMIGLADQLMEPESLIVLLPMGGTMKMVPDPKPEREGKTILEVKYTSTQLTVIDEMMSFCEKMDREIILADGIALRQRVINDSFKGKTIWETNQHGLVAATYDHFCRSFFGI